MPRKLRKSIAVIMTVIFILTQTLAGTALAGTSLMANGITANTVSLVWVNSVEDTTGLYVSPAGAGTWTSATVSELVYSSVSATVYGLSPNTSYDFKVTTTGSPSEAVANNITTTPGSYSLNVVLLEDNGTPINVAGVSIGISGQRQSPSYNITNSSGTVTFASLSEGYYSVWPSTYPAGFISIGSPGIIWLDGNSTVNIFLRRAVENISTKKITANVTGLPSGQIAEVFAGSQNDSVSIPITGTGSLRSVDLYLKRGEIYNIGLYPVYKDWTVEQINFVIPQPTTFYVPEVSQESLFPAAVSINLLSASSTINVTVLDQSGNPIPNASVYAYSPLSSYSGGSGYTGATGNCSIRVEAGNYTVGVEASGIPDMPEQTASVGNTPVSLTFRAVSPNLTLSGRVLDAQSNGIANASVWAVTTDGRDYSETITNNSGNYTLRVKNGTWNVGASADGFGSIPEITVTMSNVNQTNQNLQVPPANKFITVSGTVTMGGSPVAKAQIWAEETQGRAGNRTTTNDNGEYEFNLYKGSGYSYTIHAWIPGYGEKSSGKINSNANNFNFAVDPAYIKVIFSNDSSRNFSGYVAAYNGSSFSGKDFSNVNNVMLKMTPGGASYTVEAYIDGVGKKIITGIPVSTSNTEMSPATADFSGLLTEMVNYSVTIRGTGGSALKDAFVSMFSADGNIAGSGLTNDSGQIFFNVPSGSTIKISAKKQDYVPYVSEALTVNSSASATVITMESAQSLAVTGNVTTTTGNISSVFVWATEAGGGWVGQSYTNDNSDNIVGYTLYLPKAGNWVVSASADGYVVDGADSSRTVSGAATLNIMIKPIVGYQAGIKKETLNATGGAINNTQVGVKLIIPTGSLGLGSGQTASVTTRNTTSIPDTGTVKTVGAGREVNVIDSSGRPINTLNNKIEISLDYSSYVAQLTTEQINSLQLAYWDSVAQDWVVIPSVNDMVNHVLRGYTNHLTKFAVVYPQTLVIRGMANQSSQPRVSSGGSSTGNLISDSAGNLISDSALNSSIETAKITGKVTLPISSSSKEVALTIEQINKIETTAKPVEVKISGVTFNFNAEVLKSSGLNMSKIKSFTLAAQKTGESTTGGTGGNNLYRLSGNIFLLNARVKMEDNTEQDIKQFNGKITVSLPVPEGSGDVAAKGNLRAGRFNEVTNSWDEVAGSYDASSGIYIFETERFSKWALLEKESLPVKTFSDVTSHWARTEIEYMASNGYISGMGDGLYSPDASVTRAQFATMLVNVLKLDGRSEIPFGDVSPGDWYYFSVGRAYAAGLVKGTGPNLFSPEDLITREQMSAMICNALKYKGLLAEVSNPEEVLRGFSDQPSISGWARKSSAQAVKHEILRGKPSGGQIYFAPADKATRAEAAVMLKNLVGQLK